ncbi:MAG: chromate transporter [Oscillospiraceae bacterium]|jgi:chromate transporter|nr:chromate transporter [Oscillospiraceae bacterium]
MTLYVQLFVSFLQVGVLCFGGGYASIPLIQAQVVTHHGWLTMDMFADLVTIAEMTPGPIAINSATFVGQRVGGLLGSLVATTGFILPPALIVMALAWLYKRYSDLWVVQGILGGIRPAVVALIASAGLGIFLVALWPNGVTASWLSDVNIKNACVFAAVFFALRKWKPSPVVVILCTSALGVLLYLVFGI